MRRQYKTQGIIIKRSNFMESDRLLDIYTRDYGRVRAVAKGVRKTKSKLSGHLELFYLTDFVIHKGKNLDLITSANLLESYKNIRDDSELVNTAYYLSELVYRSTHEDLASRGIFKLINDTFSNITFQNRDKLICYFELKLFDILGHRPEVGKCVICSSKISDEKNYFDYFSGGLVCKKCLKDKERAVEVDKNLVKILRIIEKQNSNYFERIKVNDKMISDLKKCICQIRHNVLEDELKSSKFL